MMTGALSVTVFPASYAEFIPQRAEVVLTGSDGTNTFTFPTYYVSSRAVNDNNTCTFSCVDGMARAEAIVNDGDLTYDDKGLISVDSVLLYINGKCGFSGGIPSGETSLTPYLDRNKIQGCSCREILEGLSEAWCGYWRVDTDNSLVFRRPEAACDFAYVDKYAAPLRCGSVEYNSVIMSDGDEVYSRGDKADRCISIDTSYASQDAADAAYTRFKGYKYIMWRCQGCILPKYVPAGTEIGFIGEDRPSGYYLCNSVTIMPCASGIFGVLARNTISDDEWAYKSNMERKLSKKQTKGDKVTVFVNYNA